MFAKHHIDILGPGKRLQDQRSSGYFEHLANKVLVVCTCTHVI